MHAFIIYIGKCKLLSLEMEHSDMELLERHIWANIPVPKC